MHHCVQDISAAMAKPSGKVSRLDTSLTMEAGGSCTSALG